MSEPAVQLSDLRSDDWSFRTTTPEIAIKIYVFAINVRDIDLAVDLYDPEACLMDIPDEPAHGHDAIRERLITTFRAQPTMSVNAQKTIQHGDIAISMFNWTMQGIDPEGNVFVTEGNATNILRKRSDGVWRILVDNPWGPEICS
jgi:ketosteroid isomerase-like protein